MKFYSLKFRLNYSVLKILLFFSLLVFCLAGDDPALKISLNPPEEPVNDTIGNLCLIMRIIRGFKGLK
jgi:hypothetical protein